MKNLLIFLAGGAIGAVVSVKLVEKYYKELADEEIESVVEYYRKRYDEKNNENNKVETEIEPKKNKEKDKAQEIIKDEGYSSDEDELVHKPIDSIVGFEIIDPNDYGEEDEYDTKSWMFWNDGILTDEHDNVVDEPEQFIGDALSHFGDIEEDSVYVRNHATQTDYEILRSEKEFNA